MAVIGQAKSDIDRLVRCKYVPIAENYKGYAMPVSVCGEDDAGRSKTVDAVMRPGQWMMVPVAIAKMLKSQSDKFNKRRVPVPDGRGLEEAMASQTYTAEKDGVRYHERDEYTSPDYEILIDGSL